MLGVRCQVVVVGLTGAMLVAPHCMAQQRGTVEIAAIVGNYFPSDAFDSQQQHSCFLSSCGPGVPPDAVKQRSFAPGGRITAWLRRRLAVEATGEYSSSTSVDDIFAASLRGVFALVRAGATAVYLAGGPAAVFHNVATWAPHPTYDDPYTLQWMSHSAAGGVVGAGLHIRTSPALALRADYEEYFSSLDGKTQRDPFFSFGVSLRILGS